MAEPEAIVEKALQIVEENATCTSRAINEGDLI